MAMDADPQLESAADPGTEDAAEATAGGDTNGSAQVAESTEGDDQQKGTDWEEAYKGLQRKLEEYAPVAGLAKQVGGAKRVAELLYEYDRLITDQKLGKYVQQWRTGSPVEIPDPAARAEGSDVEDDYVDPEVKRLRDELDSLKSQLGGQVREVAVAQIKDRVKGAMQEFYRHDLFRHLTPDERKEIEADVLPKFESYMETEPGRKQLASLTADQIVSLVTPRFLPIIDKLVDRKRSNTRQTRAGRATDAPFSAATTGREARAEGEPAQNLNEMKQILEEAIREAHSSP